MGIQRTAIAVVTLTLAETVLAGCVSPAPPPPPPTQEEIDAVIEAQAQIWWDSMATGTTMPDIEIIERLPLEEAIARQTQCLDDANLPGVTVRGPGEWMYDAPQEDPVGNAAQVQWWLCTQLWPAEDNFDWMLSEQQLDWLYSFYLKRFVPCLRVVGFEPVDFPSREVFVEGNGSPIWIPYEFFVTPTPTPTEWDLIAQRCPLPDMLADYGLPGYTDEP